MNRRPKFSPIPPSLRTCPFDGLCGVSCAMWIGGPEGGCGLAKAAAALPEIEKRLYDIHRDLQGGLADIRQEIEAK